MRGFAYSTQPACTGLRRDLERTMQDTGPRPRGRRQPLWHARAMAQDSIHSCMSCHAHHPS
jgi:hypothetical protein